MFKTFNEKKQKQKKKKRENYTKDIYDTNQFLPISVVYCSHTKKKSSKQVLTFTKFKP